MKVGKRALELARVLGVGTADTLDLVRWTRSYGKVTQAGTPP